jgi:hypothetical protein
MWSKLRACKQEGSPTALGWAIVWIAAILMWLAMIFSFPMIGG